jgi:hypothetical protein
MSSYLRIRATSGWTYAHGEAWRDLRQDRPRVAYTGSHLKKAPLKFWIVVAVVVAALAMPIKQRCGAPGRTCATAQDAQGNVHYYYEVEPVAIFLMESVLGSNIPLYYTSGEDVVKVG